MRQSEKDPRTADRDEQPAGGTPNERADLDQALEDSFPASDPPAQSTPTAVGKKGDSIHQKPAEGWQDVEPNPKQGDA